MNKRQIFQDIIFLSAFALIIYMALALIFPITVMDIVEPMPVEKEQYKAGERITYKADLCKKEEAQGYVTVNMIQLDGTYTEGIASGRSGIDTGCRILDFSTDEIASYVPEGVYHLEVTISYKVHPLRTVTHTYTTTPFNIKK